MTNFEIEAQGRRFEVEAPDMQAATSALNQTPMIASASSASAGLDVPDMLKSHGIGAAKGAIGIAGMGGDARELNASAINKISKGLRYKEWRAYPNEGAEIAVRRPVPMHIARQQAKMMND